MKHMYSSATFFCVKFNIYIFFYLGNRTTQQVCSRVQKYFKKLHKAGLDVPATSKRYGRQKVSETNFVFILLSLTLLLLEKVF